MSAFSELQIQDLRDLKRAAHDLGAEAVIIGAMACRLFIEDADRQTYDIDLAVALDLDGFRHLEEALGKLGWHQQKNAGTEVDHAAQQPDRSLARGVVPS